jgi:hypothetical protein
MVRDRRIGQLWPLLAGIVVLLALTGGRPEPVLTAPLRPDLVETAVSITPWTVQAGGSLRVTDVVRNRGGARDSPSTTGYSLSPDRGRGPGDLRLRGRSLGRVGPRVTTRRSTTMLIPFSTMPGSYRVLACADDRHRVREADEANNCRAATHAVEVRRPPDGDHTPPRFAGLTAATTCVPGPIGGGSSARYHLRWEAAADNVTSSSDIVYDVYQGTVPGGENYFRATYTSAAGATSFTTPPLPADKAYYFVVRARDRGGNRDSNRAERMGVNLCE